MPEQRPISTVDDELIKNNSRLNTFLAIITIGGIFGGTFFFLAPLKTLPDDVNAMKKDMSELQKTQAMQSVNLSMLTSLLTDQKDQGRMVDKNTIIVADHERRITNIEAQLIIIKAKQ